MNVFLHYLQPDGSSIRSWLREGQAMTVGRSHRADLCIESDAWLADVHFRVALESGRCFVHSVVRGPNALLINGGRSLDAELKDQDTIQAGTSFFRVSIERRGGLVAESPASDHRASGEVTLAVTSSRLPTNVGSLRLAGGAPYTASVVRTLADERFVLFLANFRHASLTLPEGVDPNVDLFLHAPNEVRATNSLHVLTSDELCDLPTLTEQLTRRDAGLWLVVNQPRETFLPGHRFVWAWFARPSLLSFQLANGTPELASHLFRDVTAAVVATPEGDNLAVYCQLEDLPRWHEQLGRLEVPKRSVD